MSLKESMAGFRLRPRVVHSLPGRLRVYFPLLKRMPGENSGLVELAARLLGLPGGIREVSPCLVTGNVLVRYDTDRLTEEDVLNYLQSTVQLLLANRDRLATLSADKVHESEDRLREWLAKRVTWRLKLDGNLRIPDDVLA